MNENQRNMAMQEIKEVFEKMQLEVDGELSTLTTVVAYVEVGVTNLVPAYLFVDLNDQRKGISLELDIDCEINESCLKLAIEAVNLINRQNILGCLLVQLGENQIHVKKDIALVSGRLNKTELQQTIQSLIDNASFYYEEVFEGMDGAGNLTEQDKQRWVNSSYLHKECRSGQ